LTEQCLQYFKSGEQQENDYLLRIFNSIDGETLETMRMGINKLIENTDKLLGINEQGA